jgi:hypothetical protein
VLFICQVHVLTRIRSATRILVELLLILSSVAAMAGTNSYLLARSSAPTNNPLKGFMPYAGSYSNMPYSMEWGYLPLRTLMTGPTNFDWSSLDTLLGQIAGHGHQTVFRIYLDYPAQPTGIPQYLLDAGLATHTYTDYGNNSRSVSPDYENPLLRQALTNFIAALGARYDGDPRIGFITVGLLGFWGEWHTYPYTNWFASITVQDEVLSAYEAAFAQTKLLVRRPAGTNPTARRLGYHDDSFAYETIDPPSWMFLGLLKDAAETNKWLTQPIGGEVRPEVQPCMWDSSQTNCVPPGQDFSNCVALTHASWMLNQGAFAPGFTGSQQSLAVAGGSMLGYEFYVSNASLVDASLSEPLAMTLKVWNTGVAPFYYDWPVQLAALNASNTLVKTWTTPWKLSDLLPAATNTVWTWTQTNHGLPAGKYKLVLRVQNPLVGGVPLLFANQAQDADLPSWLSLGTVSITSSRPKLSLSGNHSLAGFGLLISQADPGKWTIEDTSDFVIWSPFVSTNTIASEWSVTDAISAPARFYRVVGSP